MSINKDELWGSIQETLKEQHYQDISSAANTSHVHSLKELVMSSAHIETGGDPLISVWTAQVGDVQDIIIGYQSLIDFLCHEENPHKLELQTSLVYPLFVYCYFIIVNTEGHDRAQKLYSASCDIINANCTSHEELHEILSLTTPTSIHSSPLAEKFKSCRYFTRVSEPAFTMLMTFLQSHPTTALLNIIQTHFNIEVFGNTIQPTNELKTENKKGCTFIKPKIEPISEIEFGISPMPRYTPPILPAPPPNDDALIAKQEYQQKLTAASQQLDPSVPSILLCTIQGSENSWIQCASLAGKTNMYACGTEDSSILVSSWLPLETADPSTNIHVLRSHYGPIYGLDFSCDGRYLLSSSEDTTVKLWDTSNNNCLVKYAGHTYPVFDVSFSSVDGYFVTSSFDRTARLWNTDRVYPLRIFAGHDDSVDTARFHPNSNYIATGSKDHTCRLWDINDGGCVRLFLGSKSSVTVLAFSPFGKHLASATHDGTITVWDMGSSKVIRELKGHTSNITSLAYTCDSTLLASTSEDKTVKLWSMKAVLAHSGSDSGSNQGLIFSQSTGAVLPLHAEFTHRNRLVIVGASYNEKTTNFTTNITQ